MMKSAHCLLLTLTVLAFCPAATYAGITSWQNNDDPADSVIVTGSLFDNVANTWHVNETFLSSGTGVGTLDVTAQADADPLITITKTVDNNSGFAWYGYRVDIAGTAGYTGNATTDQGTWSLTREYWTANTCGFEFDGSNPVLPGQDLTLSFTIGLPAGGFNFQIEQTPLAQSVPAPAALVLAGIGATAVARRRRRATR